MKTNEFLRSAVPTILVFASMLVAMYWAFSVPIFQSPDEDFHSDYIFSLYSRGRLFTAREKAIAAISHPFISYLLNATDGQTVKWRSVERMPPGYGSKKYFHQIDQGAPHKDACVHVKTNPFMIIIYPVGYYALTALWLSCISFFNNSLSVLFFAGRLFSVILLGAGLSLSYCIMRELGLSWRRSCLLLAAICFFPLVSFVGSYIQPDNLSFVSVSACLLLALRWRKQPKWKTLCSLALTMGVLLLSKYHFFVCTGVAIIAMVLTKKILMRSSLKNIAYTMILLLIPSILAGILQLWISVGAYLPEIDNTHYHWFAVTTGFNQAIQNGSLLQQIRDGLSSEYKDLYLSEGWSFAGFWGYFGWEDTPLIIFSSQVNDLLRAIIEWMTFACLIFTLANIIRIFIRLCRLASKKKIRQALFLACANPVLNSYFLFVPLMFVFMILVYPTFSGQGRHWFPYILPIFLNATIYAPQMLIKKSIKQISFYVITISLILYAVIGNYYSIQCINDRYYKPLNQPPTDISKLEKRPEYASSEFFCVPIDPLPNFDRHLNPYSFPLGRKIWLTGWAIDFIHDALASAVLIYIDDKFVCRANYGTENTIPVKMFADTQYRFSGFNVVVPTIDLSRGKHVLKMKVVSADGCLLYDSGYSVKFDLK